MTDHARRRREPAVSQDVLRDDMSVTVDLTDHGTRPIPFVDMDAIHGPIRREIREAIEAVVERGDFILGEAVERFESEFASYVGVDHAVGVDSGFSALELLLRAHDVGPGDEVITVANTFFATAMAIVAVGATPVLVDMDPRTHLIDPVAVEGVITARTRAIIPVHLYGRPAPMDRLAEIARRHGLIVIEDAAQAHGAGPPEARAGSLGDGGAFSFYPSKNLGAMGDGGAITVDDPHIAESLRALRNLGSTPFHKHLTAGFNHRLDTLQAAILSVKLPHLDAGNASRRESARLYGSLLAGLPVATPDIGDDHVVHLYVIETDDRARLVDHLAERSIATGIHYAEPIHLQPAFQRFGWREGDFPYAERACRRILSLPMFPGMAESDIERVADAVRSFFD